MPPALPQWRGFVEPNAIRPSSVFIKAATRSLSTDLPTSTDTTFRSMAQIRIRSHGSATTLAAAEPLLLSTGLITAVSIIGSSIARTSTNAVSHSHWSGAKSEMSSQTGGGATSASPESASTRAVSSALSASTNVLWCAKGSAVTEQSELGGTMVDLDCNWTVYAAGQ